MTTTSTPLDAELIKYDPTRPLPHVFIASPYTHGGTAEENVRRSVEMGARLAQRGLCFPVVPLLTHQWEILVPQSYQFWIEYTKHMLSSCDALLRLPGDSHGADGEVDEANRLGMPVFFYDGTVESLRPLFEFCTDLLHRRAEA